MAQRLKTDWILFATVLAMVSFGLLILYSASSVMAQMDPQFDSSWHFVHPPGWCGRWSSVAVMMALKKTHYRKLQNPAVAFARHRRGADAAGARCTSSTPRTTAGCASAGRSGVQPSELAKPALVVFLAFFVTWRARAINNPRYTLIPAALAVGLVILAVVVADLGTAVVLGAAAAVVFFVAGLEWRYCAIVGGLALLGWSSSSSPKPYRLAPRGEVLRSRVQDRRPVRPAGHDQEPGCSSRWPRATPTTSCSNRRSRWAPAVRWASG